MQNVSGMKIFVGLSGGVDSAVSAALLQRAGAHVTGVFIKGWYPPNMPCTWADDRRDAMRVAAHLGIPFHTLDASVAYKKGVIDYLLSEYAAGRTPNPDSMCNREVKFGAFYSFAKEHGANFIATGHYARAVRVTTEHSRESRLLYRGRDSSKDQSYFLWAVPKEALAHTLFPVGEMPKSETRTLANRFNLPVAEKRDSQGICFLGSISVDDFLRQEFHPELGNAVNELGELVGVHDGALLHTLGSRVALQNAKQGPWYVIAKDMQTNTLTVSKGQFDERTVQDIKLRETNWFREVSPAEKISAQYRYHGPIVHGTYTFESNTFIPREALMEPVASGQSLVLYVDDECIGGGIIV
jgi:tRNA-specific 2-thiouridylase